jgi:hypothetical protein
MKALNNEKGFIKVALTLTILALLVYAGIEFGRPYYKYSALKSDAKEIARITIGEVERAKEQVLERAQELKIPLTEDKITVTKTEKTVRIRTSWSETVDFLGLYQKTFHFKIDVEE